MRELERTFSAEGVRLRSKVPIRFPLHENDPEIERELLLAPAAWAALEELWQDGGVAVEEPGTFRVEWEQCVDLDEGIARALELPTASAAEVWLESKGTPIRDGFRIDAVVRDREHGLLPLENRSGPAFVLSPTDCVLLERSVYELLEAVRDVPGPGASVGQRLGYLARCREAASVTGAHEDGFLSRENVATNAPIAVDFEEDGDEILLSPRSGDLDEKDLLLGNGRPRGVVSRREADGSFQRVVVSPEAAEQIRGIGERARVTGADVPKLLTNPEAFVPEGVDLSLFSNRVTGFRTRVYNSRPYIHVREQKRGWFDVEWGVATESTAGSPDEGEAGPQITRDDYQRMVEQARETGERFVRHGNDWIEVDPDQGDRFGESVRKLSEAATPDGLPKNMILEVIPNVDELGFEVTLPDSVTDAASASFDALPPRNPPAGLLATLQPHQMLGYRWLGHLREIGGGGLLADDMGVGKTMQVIAHFLALAEEGRLSPSLLVLPKTLIPNWWNEIRQFAPSLERLLVYDGPSRPRNAAVLSAADVVLTTYETVRRDQFLLGQVDWEVVVCDEAQFVKNPTAGRTAAVKALKAKQPIALTGTPVENGLIEFWCIVDFVQPGRLQSWADFRSQFERPLAQADEEERKPLVEGLLHRLEPHYLRRLKEEVLESLPPKQIVSADPALPSSAQKHLYQRVIEEAKAGGPGEALAAIGKLLRVCAHPRCELGGSEQIPVPQLVEECPKLAQTLEILREVKSRDEKALIFAEWKSAQRILQRTVGEILDFWPSIVNGDVNANRLELVESFCRRPGFGVMVLSPHVAGYGLNIVAANHVIHYTRPWNPAKENQATDRVHRIGQTKPVSVYYPIVAGTAEERLAELLAEKQALARDVLRPSSERMVSPEDLLGELEKGLRVATG